MFGMHHRRQFIRLLAGAATSTVASPQIAPAQQAIRRIGLLLGIAENDPEARSRVKAFQRGLLDLGWVEGRNIRVEYRYAASDPNRIKEYVTELVNLAPEVIVGNSTPVIAALRQATNNIPIVFAVVNDPVGQGFISSLAHPGANITGFTFIEFEMVGKWVTMLKDVVPRLSHTVLLFNPTTAPYYDIYLRSFEATRTNNIAVTAAHVLDVAGIDATIAKLSGDNNAGLIAPADPFVVVNRAAIMSAADKYRVPAIYTYRQFVREGGLMAYGPDTADIFRRSAAYVDRILKGALPADLPPQAPTKFELVVNLQTAKKLGLSISDTFLLLADEVIE